MAATMEARRPLHRHERALVYAVLGWAMEVVFTGIGRAVDRDQRDRRLMGHSYLWMGPIYASVAVLYEPLHTRLRGRPRWQRGAAYAAGFLAVEYAAGMALKRITGVIPWDYTGHSRFQLGGAARLDYAPLWAGCGLVLETIHDELIALPVRRVGR